MQTESVLPDTARPVIAGAVYFIVTGADVWDDAGKPAFGVDDVTTATETVPEP